MPVLLMTRGDAQSRELLRRAIEARYGFRPPALESLRVDLKGRMRVARGLYKGWAPITLRLSIRFPFAAQARFAGRLLGLPIGGETDAFDGAMLRRGRQRIDDPRMVESVRRRLWALNTLLLTPLNDPSVELRAAGEQSFDTVHLASGLTATVTVDEMSRVTGVNTTAFNPQSGHDQIFYLQPGEAQTGFADLILPARVTAAWDDAPFLELSPTSAQTNPSLAESLFTLEK